MKLTRHEVEWWLGTGWRHLGQAMRFQETLRRLAMIDEGLVEDQAGLGLAGTSALDPKTAALLRLGGRWPSGRPESGWNGAPAGRCGGCE